MRVISGSAKGRPLKAPPGFTTRPMTDRLKISLFDTLAPFGIEGARVLDLYSGSGSLGIEMLSRGAEWCDFVEQNRAVCDVILDNLRATGLTERSHVFNMAVGRFLAMKSRNSGTDEGNGAIESVGDRVTKMMRPLLPDDIRNAESGIAIDENSMYDIILLDPPYADPEIERTLEIIALSSLIAVDGNVVIGHRKGVKLSDSYGGGNLNRVRNRSMGDSAFSIYVYAAEGDEDASRAYEARMAMEPGTE